MFLLVTSGPALDQNSPGRRSYICPCAQPPRRPATGAVCWPLARRWASSSAGSDEACSSPGSRAPWYCGRDTKGPQVSNKTLLSNIRFASQLTNETRKSSLNAAALGYNLKQLAAERERHRRCVVMQDYEVGWIFLLISSSSLCSNHP